MRFLIFLVFKFILYANAFGQIAFSNVYSIISKHCINCHHDNGSAPFSLQSPNQIKKYGKMISMVIETKFMPPWKANPNYSHFADERIMNEEEISIIKNWVKEGMQINNQKKDVDPVLKSKQKPDLVLRMPIPVTIKGNNKETFMCYKIPFEIDAEHPVAGIEFIPGNKKLVHHASYQIIEVSPNAKIFEKPYFFYYNDSISNVNDERDFEFLNLTDSKYNKPKIRFHTGWLPGVSIQKYPLGIGFNIPKRGVLLIRNLHYSATNTDETDLSEVRIYFAKEKIERVIEFAAFKPNNLDPIIPKDSTKKYFMTLRINSNMSLLSINPHMHKIGKYFKSYIITPKRDTVPLIEIKNWDFNWQEFYRFKKILRVDKGSYLNVEATYDNTQGNFKNPNNPPKDIFFERGAMDDEQEEMLRLSFLYLPYKENDENINLE